MRPEVTQALRSLGSLAALLETDRSALCTDEVAQLSQMCTHVSELLQIHTPLPSPEGESMVITRRGSNAAVCGDAASRHATRIRSQRTEAANNRLSQRRNGSQVEESSLPLAAFERMFESFMQRSADQHHDEEDGDTSDGALPAVGLLPSPPPRLTGQPRPRSAERIYPAGATLSDVATRLATSAADERVEGMPLRGPRQHAASFQALRHSQRRTAALDEEEIARALAAAERALGLQTGTDSDGQAHGLEEEETPSSGDEEGYESDHDPDGDQAHGNLDSVADDYVPQGTSRHAARFREQHAAAANNRLQRRRGASINQTIRYGQRRETGTMPSTDDLAKAIAAAGITLN
jgi:hypothetical protein